MVKIGPNVLNIKPQSVLFSHKQIFDETNGYIVDFMIKIIFTNDCIVNVVVILISNH